MDFLAHLAYVTLPKSIVACDKEIRKGTHTVPNRK